MSLKLNRVDDAIQLSALAHTEERLAIVLAPNSRARARGAKQFAHVLGGQYFEIGTAYYQQQRDPIKVREYLALAAHYMMDDAALPPAQPGSRPWEFERTLALAVCFASQQDVAKGLSVADDLIFVPVNNDARRLYRLSLEYVNLVRSYISLNSLDVERAKRFEIECKDPSSWKADSIQTHAKLRALRALFESETEVWNHSLEILVREHKDESMRGDFQRLNLAFICLPALLLAKLGIDKGLKCTVSSPYLPIELL